MSNFCGKCGKPIQYCTCNNNASSHGGNQSQSMSGGANNYGGNNFGGGNNYSGNSYGGNNYGGGSFAGYSTDANIGNLALGQGEEVVKRYVLGKYPLNTGVSELQITNKRVILKEHYSFLFLSRNRVEELNLESVHGINGFIGRSINWVVFIIGLIMMIYSGVLFTMSSMFSRYGDGGGKFFFWGMLLMILGVVVVIASCIFPSMTFGVIGMGSDHQSLMTGANLIGKKTISNGVIFQPRPVRDAANIIREAGACIYDLRTYGDEAIKKWKN